MYQFRRNFHNNVVSVYLSNTSSADLGGIKIKCCLKDDLNNNIIVMICTESMF